MCIYSTCGNCSSRANFSLHGHTEYGGVSTASYGVAAVGHHQGIVRCCDWVRPMLLSKMTTVNEISTTYAQAVPANSSLVMPCEHSMPLNTGAYRAALAFNLMPDVVALRRNFSEIVVTNVRAEVRQEHLLGSETLEVSANGRVFVAVIPSGKNTDAASGTNGSTVMSVRRKQAFPLSSTIQENKVYAFDLTGFETDVAQDPRRQQGLVAWLGNTGITAAVKGETFPFVSVTWYFDCVCTGIAANW